jgi:GNAT superfamily N-acetyltransferase
MSSIAKKYQHQTWTKDAYQISTDSSLIPISCLTEAFATDDVYWADPMPEEEMRVMLQNSLCFGLYELDPSTSADAKDTAADTSESRLRFLGIARCVTDFTTFLYLTDVYVCPSSQGKGLGAWLVSCVQEVIESMPYLRRSMLLTGDWKRSVPFYEKMMGMTVLEGRKGKDGEGGEGLAVMTQKGKGHPSMRARAREEESTI